jgi:aminoglycoside phosphotransferase (APT) family kinase protein
MATGILATNGPAVAEQVRRLRGVLDRWLEELDASEPDASRLRERLAAARERAAADQPNGDG